MIQSLRDNHTGSRIAVVGSGPTATLYRGACDVSLAINGAALLPHHFSYFICGDPRSPHMNWFYVNCSDVRIVADLVATCDQRLYPHNQYPSINRLAVYQHQKDMLGEIPEPVYPHLIFRFERFSRDQLHKEMNYLMYGGTMSCGALQLAWLMGASAIDIYGCPFTHAGGSYFYQCNNPGAVSQSQLQTMQTVIDIIRETVEVSIIGESLLK